MGVKEVLVILDRESVLSSNAADMRRVMKELSSELRAATQPRSRRGDVVQYDGVHIAATLAATVRTMRSWGVDV